MPGKRRTAAAAVFFTALILIAVNLGWWWYYRSITGYFEEQLSFRLKTSAATAALAFEPHDVDSLLLDNLDTWARVYEYLDSLASIESLSEASIIDIDFRYLVTMREDFNVDRYLLAVTYLEKLQLALAGDVAATDLYDIDGTYLKSAYAPLRGSDGLVDALLVVEAGAEYFEQLTGLRRNLYLLAGGSAAVIIILLVVYVVYSRRLADAEEALFRAGAQATLGRMVAVVSHEIKNPLMILRAAGERLAKKHDDQEAAFVVDEVNRLNEIVTGYLSFARGDLTLHKEKIDLRALIDSLVTEVKPQCRKHGISLELHLPEHLPPLFADYRALRQVLLNLLFNALDAAQEAQVDMTKRLDIRADTGDEKVDIVIGNTGEKIPRAEREKLFEPFYTTKTKGSGLGLYISRLITEKHGGKLEFVDNAASSTAIRLTLPVAEESS
jgi:signal transduction histidine kinase